MKTKKRLLSTMMLVASVVTTASAQEHKTYSGQFGRENEGTVTYSYYENADGQRMFDGKYTYKKVRNRTGNSATYTETGQYKDDRLDGLWTLTFNKKGYENETMTVKMNYKDGLLHGPMTFVKKVVDSGKVTENYDLTLLFDEGYLIGKASNMKLGMYVFSYEFDENNLPNGIWKRKLDRKQEEAVNCSCYDHGKLMESYYEYITTGDRVSQSTDELQVGMPLIEAILNLLIQPYYFKEMPIRSSLTQKQKAVNNTLDKGNKYGFLGYRSYGDTY